MAIDAYVGKPRSGKSYSVVKQVILPSLKEGRHVYTNIPLTEVAHDEFPGMIHQFEKDWYKDREVFSRIPNGSVVVADEVWRRWPKGMAANAIPAEDKAFLAEHGHLVGDNGKTTRVVLVTQDLDQLSAFCLTLIDKTYQSVKLDKVGASSKFRVDIYDGSAKGERPPKSRLIRSTYDSYSDKYWVYYKSATLSQTDEVGDESRADKRANIWRSPFIIFSIVGPIIGIPLAIWYLVGLFSSGMGYVKDEPDEPAVIEQSGPVNPMPAGLAVAPVASPEHPKAPPEPKVPSESQRWRVAGHIHRLEPETGRMADAVMLTDGRAVTYLAMAECEPVSLGFQYRCMFGGEWVTPWSGPGPISVTDSIMGVVPIVGGERSEQAQQAAPTPSIVNPAPGA